MSNEQKFFKWTVEFQVSDNWVADGFELTDEIAHEMIHDRLGYAYDRELKAKVIKKGIIYLTPCDLWPILFPQSNCF